MADFGREAEIGIIGSVLLDNGALAPAREILQRDDFFSEETRVVYAAMLSLSDEGTPINLATVAMRVGADVFFDKAGGVQFLLACERDLPSACNVPHFARIVRAESLRRKVVAFGAHLSEIGQKPMRDADAQIASLSDELMRIADGGKVSPTVSLGESVGRVCAAIVNHESKRFVKSGFTDIDGMINGFYDGSLTVIAARPSMGKTALGLCIASNVAILSGIPVLFFSLEMQTDDLTTRIISARAGVDGNSIRRETLTCDEIGRILDAAKDIDGAPLRIDDTGGIDIAVLMDRARREHRANNTGMIVVDYLQLVTCRDRSVQTREQIVSTVSRSLKALAKELSIPVIALAQLSRATETRADKKPLLSDLRESGAIEQDADNVLFIHREDYYTHQNTNEAEIIIAKQRSGPTGIVKLHWDGRYTRFSNLRNEYYDQNFR